MAEGITSYGPPLDDSRLEAFIRQLPKAELHLHLEGALRWSTVRELHPDRATLPARPPWLDRPFVDFAAFRDAFVRYIRPSSGTPERIERHTYEVLIDLAAQNVRHVELTLSTWAHRDQGLGEREVLAAMQRGRTRAVAETRIDASFSYGINRHQPLVEVRRAFDQALDCAGPAASGLLAAIDLQGDERVAVCADFVPIFDAARAAGLRVRAHAGELCGPASVRAAVDQLGVGHLAHGVRAVEDAALVRQLAERAIWLHVAPTSNLRLGVAACYADHPLPRLLAAGCACTISSDDPLLFGTTISDEYRNLVRAFGLTADAIAELAKSAFRASLLDPLQQAQHCAAIDSLRAAS